MKLTMVVVLYKLKPEESKTYRTLQKTLFSKHIKDVDLILYDNSPERHTFTPPAFEGIHISYVHDPRNSGIMGAYNYAWNKAKEDGSDWLLLLDHDTELTQDYVDKVFNLGGLPNEIAAVVPKIHSEKQIISPVYSGSLRPLTEERPVPGLQEKPVMAINSGALIQVEFLNKIGGFNKDFPLDYLDHWLFYEIYANGRKVCLLDVTLEHELSVMDYSRVSLDRYKSILDSEILFFKNYKKDLYGAYRTQLVKRVLKQILTVKNKKIALYTLKKLFSM